MAAKQSKWIYYTPVVGWGVFVFIMSLLPGSELPDPLLALNDLLIHGSIYVIWVWAAAYGVIKTGNPLSLKLAVLIFSAASAFGLIVEWAQATFTTTRHFEGGDLLANAIGSLIGLALAPLVFRKK